MAMFWNFLAQGSQINKHWKTWSFVKLLYNFFQSFTLRKKRQVWFPNKHQNVPYHLPMEIILSSLQVPQVPVCQISTQILSQTAMCQGKGNIDDKFSIFVIRFYFCPLCCLFLLSHFHSVPLAVLLWHKKSISHHLGSLYLICRWSTCSV